MQILRSPGSKDEQRRLIIYLYIRYKMNRNEIEIMNIINDILSRNWDNLFVCKERKLKSGGSSIGKPADLGVYFKGTDRAVIAIEVANVNSTQLVGEVTRLYCDHCPNKMLIMYPQNAPKDAKERCEILFRILYGQNDIKNTPARVEWHDDKAKIEVALKYLLCR
jgi:hypothetical protein